MTITLIHADDDNFAIR